MRSTDVDVELLGDDVVMLTREVLKLLIFVCK